MQTLLQEVQDWDERHAVAQKVVRQLMSEYLKEQQLQKAVKQAVRFLEAQGLKVS